jgi:hypothetical protein
MLIALFSQYYLRVYRATWFRKVSLSEPSPSLGRAHLPLSLQYNYLLSAGLDGGTQFMVFVATFGPFSLSTFAQIQADFLSLGAAIFGGSGKPVDMPNWALNPDTSRYNFDYCQRLT